MAAPLDGMRIIDLTTVAFGPYATQTLGDYGAEVIKVEAPEGDIIRTIAPYRNRGMGYFFLMANRNKRCVVLDLKTTKGREAFLRLVGTADAVMTSVRPAGMARLGLGYEDCRAANPDLIYVALVGFGQDGPYAPRPAYDDIIQGESGMAAMQGGRDGEPRFVKASIADKIGSQFVVHATLAAFLARERGEGGQLVEVPMFESLATFNLTDHQAGQTFEPPLGPAGYERAMVDFRRPFATADGHVCVLPYNTRHWQTFFRLMGRPDLVDDPRVTDAGIRSEKIGELYEIVGELTLEWRTDELLKALEEADIPSGRATRLDDVPTHPQAEAVGLFQWHDHPSEGRIRLARPPALFSKTPAEIRTLPAALGAHSAEILADAGYSPEEIRAMVEEGVTIDGRTETDQAAE